MQRPFSVSSAAKKARTALLLMAWGGAVGAPRGAAAPDTASVRPVLVAAGSHVYQVTQIRWSRDGKHLVTTSKDDTTRVREASTGREMRRFLAPARAPGASTRSTSEAAFSPDGRTILMADGAEAVAYDAATGAEVRRYVVGPSTSTPSPLVGVAFADAGRIVVTAAQGGGLHLFPVGDGRRPRSVPGVKGPLSAFATSGDGKYVFCAGGDRTERRLAATGGLVGTYPSTDGEITDVAASDDGNVLVTGSASGKMTVWSGDRTPPQVLRSIAVGGGRILDVDVTPDGRHVASAGGDGIARIWDLRDTMGPPSTLGRSGVESWCVAFSPDGRSLARIDGKGELSIHGLGGGADAERTFPSRAVCVSSVAFSGDGGLLALRSAGDVRIWDCDTGGYLRRFEAPNGVVALSPEGRRVLSVGRDGVPWISNAYTGDRIRSLEGSVEEIRCACFAPDGQGVVTGGAAGGIRVWDASADRRRELRGDAAPIRSLALSARGDRLLAHSESGIARVWDLTTGALRREFPVDPPTRTSDLSPDGTLVALRVSELEVEIRSVATGATLASIPGPKSRKAGLGHTQAITSVAFSPSGGQVVTTGFDRLALIWNRKTGEQEGRLAGHFDDIWDARFSPDGRFVLTTSVDWTSRLWDVTTGKERCALATFSAPEPGPGQVPPYAGCVFDGEGRFDVSGSRPVADVYWVMGRETFSLDDFADAYADPGLLAKVLGRSKEPLRSVGARGPVTPPPRVTTEAPTADRPTVRIQVENRGGGLGRIAVDLNGKRVRDDLRGETFAAQAPRATVEVDLSGDPRLLPGRVNRIQATAYDASGRARSRGALIDYEVGGEPLPPPEIWAVVCGVSEYAGEALRLRFPAKDAQDVAQALRLAAQGLVGADKVHLTLLTSPAVPGSERATVASLRAAFEGIRAKANDVLVVYLAGHGLVRGEDREYHYLLADAESADLTDAAVRERVSVSGRQLRTWVRDVNAVGGQALFLDTCAAGRLGQTVLPEPESAASPQRAMDRFHEETGSFVLAGCAADRVSYEASLYGQGLLTYSVLLALSCGCPFQDGALVDVSRLLDFACEQVPWLSKQMGLPDDLRQRPVRASEGASFLIGKMSPEDRARVPVQLPRPVLVHASFQRNNPPSDSLALGRAVDAAVRGVPSDPGGRAPVGFVDTDQMVGAYRLTGRYDLAAKRAQVDVRLWRIPRTGDDVEVGRFEVSGPAGGPEDVARLARDVVAEAVVRLGAQPR